jgi:hypothetical protein
MELPPTDFESAAGVRVSSLLAVFRATYGEWRVRFYAVL